ncbi:MAG TPA: DUF4920 domain-containing protein [Myxococcales bacterium]|nr:DUF4920 domain-containing protein [Myxococcales bacterium]
MTTTPQKAPATDKAAVAAKTAAQPAGCGGKAGCEGKAGGCEGKTAKDQPAGACGGKLKPANQQAKAPTGKSTHHGGQFTLTDTVPLSQIMNKAKDFAGKQVKVSARVTKVCKKKGCWFVMAGNQGDGRYVRVKMKDYGFFVPLDCDGKNAVVEGTFNVKEVSESYRKHLAEDGNEDPNKVKGSKLELTLMATAIDING